MGSAEFMIRRPDTETVCHYLVYRAFDHLISKEGCFPYTVETVEKARALLLAKSDSLKNCIDRTLDEANYKLNRVTHRGLINFILRQDPYSPQGQALHRLNNEVKPTYERLMNERVLRAMYNHVLRLFLSKL